MEQDDYLKDREGSEEEAAYAEPFIFVLHLTTFYFLHTWALPLPLCSFMR